MQNPDRRRLLPCLVPALALAACAGPSGYPSLQPRAIEDVSLAEPASAVAGPATADPAAVARHAPTIERAQKADIAFKAALADGRAALSRGRGAAEGSEAWIAAQQALSRIETARAPVATALGDIDAARDSDRTRTDSGEMAATAQAFDIINQIDADEQRALAEAQNPAR